jgi:hypothetical protein
MFGAPGPQLLHRRRLRRIVLARASGVAGRTSPDHRSPCCILSGWPNNARADTQAAVALSAHYLTNTNEHVPGCCRQAQGAHNRLHQARRVVNVWWVVQVDQWLWAGSCTRFCRVGLNIALAEETKWGYSQLYEANPKRSPVSYAPYCSTKVPRRVQQEARGCRSRGCDRPRCEGVLSQDFSRIRQEEVSSEFGSIGFK